MGGVEMVADMLDRIDPLDDSVGMSLDDIETLRELDEWVPGHFWCPDTLRLVCPTSFDTYVERTEDDLVRMVVELNRGRRAWGLAQLADAAEAGDDVRKKRASQYLAHVKQASSAGRIRGVVSLFKSIHAIPSDRLNTQPDVLGTPMGVLDLDTGDMWPEEDREAVQSWLITKSTRADVESREGQELEYDERWDEFVDEIMCHDPERVSYLRRALGYSILGGNPEECMFVAYGPTTRNGKGTLLNSITHALGDYATTAAPNFLLASRTTSNGPDEALASLVGTRFVTISEPPEGRRLDESKVKALTGNDDQSTSKKYGHQFNFVPQFTMWMSCNRLPTVSDTSVFTSGRIRVIPFEAHFDGEARDITLKERFATERGMMTILAWLVEGFMDWRERGLDEPENVRQATLAYAQTGGSTVRRFIDEACILTMDASVRARDFKEAYAAWCGDRDEDPVPSKRILGELEQLAISSQKRHGGVIWYKGIALTSNARERWLDIAEDGAKAGTGKLSKSPRSSSGGSARTKTGATPGGKAEGGRVRLR